LAQKTSWTGAALTQTDINTYLMHEGGAWTTWTPAITQSGSVTCTVSRAVYARAGRMITFVMNVSITGSGTGGNIITSTLPVAASTAFDIMGTGYVYDSSANIYYPAFLSGDASTSKVAFNSTTANGATIGLGAAVMTAALASGDGIRAYGTYEAAS
jgi:hypothetical protein